MGRTWSLVAQTSGSRTYWLIASLLTTVITARYLGPDGRGVYVAAVAWVVLFSTLGNLSLAQVVIYLAAGKPKESWLGSVAGSVLTIVGLLTLAGWLAAGILYVATDGRAFQNLDPVTLALAFLSLPVMLWVETGNSILMALNRLSVMNAAQMVGATAALALAFIAVGALRWGVRGALVALALAQAVTAAIALRVILRRVDRVRVERKVVRELLTGGAKLHLNAIGTYLFSQANILILNHYRTSEETAYLQLAVQLFTGLQIVPTAIGAVTYSLVSREGPEEAWPQQRKLLFSAIALMTGASAVAYFAAPFLVRMAFGESFLPAVPLFQILLLGVVGMTMSIVMASQWISRGLFLQAALLTLAIGCIAVVANYLVVPRYGAHGAAWVTVGTYAISIIGNGVMALWVESRHRDFQRSAAGLGSSLR